MNLSEFNCPTCNKVLNDTFIASRVGGVMPSVGDLNLCGDCGCIAEFTETGLVALTDEQVEALEVEDKEDLLFAARNIRAASERNNHA